MGKIKLYIDEDLSDRLAIALRSKGYDVISVYEVNMIGRSDIEQLEFAKSQNRVILTRNIKHFIEIHINDYENGRSHTGILLTNLQPIKELLRRISRFLDIRDSEEMINQLDWLQNYKYN